MLKPFYGLLPISFGQISPLKKSAGAKCVFLKSFFYNKRERERERESEFMRGLRLEILMWVFYHFLKKNVKRFLILKQQTIFWYNSANGILQ